MEDYWPAALIACFSTYMLRYLISDFDFFVYISFHELNMSFFRPACVSILIKIFEKQIVRLYSLQP